MWIIIIILLAAFLRFWDLPNTPPGLWADEAINGTNTIQALETGGWKVFYPENFGREGLFINIQALFVKAFGHEPWVLRLSSAIFGLLTVLGFYLMAREIFSEKIALFAAFFLATSFWHINFSRIGFRAIMAPFFLVWSFYFLFFAMRKSKEWMFALAGLILGLGFHSYIAYRIAPMVALLPLWRFYKNWKSEAAKPPLGGLAAKPCAPCVIALFIFMAFLAALPLLWYYAQNPADFFGRTSAISIFQSPDPLGQFSKNFVKTLGMFNFAGDFNWRHNLAGSPQLWWPVGLLFLIGIWISIKKFRWPNNFVYLWFVAMILPVALSNESLPHALRAIVLIPPAMIFAALGLDWLIDKIKNWLADKKTKYPDYLRQLSRIERELKILLAVFFIAASAQVFNQYFFRWAPNFNVYEAFQADITEKAHWLNSEPKNIKKYVITDTVDQVGTTGTPMSFQPIIFITDTFYPQKQAEKNIYYIALKNISSADCSQKCEFVPVEYNVSIFKKIKQQIPGAFLDESKGFIVIKKPR